MKKCLFFNCCLFWVVLCLFFVACSTKKDKFINRAYHGMVSKYNILYHGQVSFQEGFDGLSKSYEDNFWEMLPIEPIKISEDEILLLESKSDNKSNNQSTKQGSKEGPFSRAEDKAVKAIQLHSMKIGKYERNSQIDDAYFLLGKSRYYTGRFVPALEAFAYIIENYPKSEYFDEAKIWRAKTNVRLQNEKIAIQTLKLLLDNKDIDDNVIQEGHMMLALAYKQLDSIPQFTYHLKQAGSVDGDKHKKSRLLYILGQSYDKQEKKDSARWAFKQILEFKKAPNRFKIHARMAYNNLLVDAGDLSQAFKATDKLIKNRDNRKYLDKLYYNKALLYFRQDSIDLGKSFLEQSISNPYSDDSYQKGLSYEKLADIYFNDGDFKKSGAYLDSLLQVGSNDKSYRIKKAEKKRNSLEEILKHENIVFERDSLFGLITMDSLQRVAYFEEYIEKLKEKEKEAQRLADIAKINKSMQGGGVSDLGIKGGKWYFYNQQTIAYGKANFQKIWGDRKRVDKWRWSQSAVEIENDSTASNQVKKVKKEDLYQVSYYLKKIPSDSNVIDSLSNQRLDSYYQLGLLYSEQFARYGLAENKFTKLLEKGPNEDMKLAVYYQLVKIFKETQQLEKQEAFTNLIFEQYPNSRFARLLQKQTNSEEPISEGTKDILIEYEKILLVYHSGDYIPALEMIENRMKSFENTEILPKLLLLKGIMFSKLERTKEFKELMEYIVANFEKTDAGKKAALFLKKK